MHTRSNPPTGRHPQDGSDSPRTPARRVPQAQIPVTPANKILRNPQLAYPSPLTPPRRIKILDYGSSVAPRNGAGTHPRILREESGPSTESRVYFSEHTRNTLAVNSLPDKQELTASNISTPPTTPLRRSSKAVPKFAPVQGRHSSSPAPTSWPSPDPSPSSSRVARSTPRTTEDFADMINRRSTSQGPSGVSPAVSRGRPSIKLEDLEFEDVEIFSTQSTIRTLSSTVSLTKSSRSPTPELARPTTRSQTRARAQQVKAEEGEPPLFEHYGAIGIFRNGQRLRPFQASDLHLLVSREKGEEVCGTNEINNIGYVVAYDMGCGKTAISIALIVHCPPPEDFKGARATLVIVPSKGLMNHWVGEVKKFAPHLVVCYYDSYSANLLMNADIVLCTYSQVQRQHDAFAPDPKAIPKKTLKTEKYWPLFKYTWFRVITDEAHQFRNPETKTAEAVWAIQKRHGLCLTGTPAQNSFLDYYPLIKFLGITYEKLHDRVKFERMVCSKKHEGEMTDRAARYRLDVLEESFFIFRDKNDDVTGNGTPLVPLPPRKDHIIDVELTHWERVVYQHVKDLRLSILATITRLRQACDHPVLVSEVIESSILGEEDDTEYEDMCIAFSTTRGIFHEKYASSKIIAMLEILEGREKGDKTIIFTHFTRLISPITQALIQADICWTEYTGDISAKAREKALEQIQVDDECTVIIVSIKAGGTGLNIAACNSVILMDPWWNPYFEEQAISRVHRIGQKKPVDVYHLVVKDSLEEYIMETQESKRRMIERGECDVKFEPKAELDEETMRAWLYETKSEQS